MLLERLQNLISSVLVKQVCLDLLRSDICGHDTWVAGVFELAQGYNVEIGIDDYERAWALRRFILLFLYCLFYMHIHCQQWLNKNVNLRSVININCLFRTSDIEAHVIQISRVGIHFALESSVSLTLITHNLQIAINFKEKWMKNKHKIGEGTN